MVEPKRARRDFRLLARHPRIEVFAHGRKHEVLAGDVSIQLRNHLLRLPGSYASARRSFQLVRDLLRLPSICFFRAPLNAPTIWQRKAGEPKFCAFSLTYAGYTDNNTDNIRACPAMFLKSVYEGSDHFA